VTDWGRWHERYDDPDSALSQRLSVVRRFVANALDSRRLDAALRIVSLCAGDGRDVLAVLADHPAGERATVRLVELDPVLAQKARTAAAAAALEQVEVVEADAGSTDALTGAAPADLLLACGVFGNVSDEDVERTIRRSPSLTAEQGVVIWTRHRRPPDLTPRIRTWFAEAGFAELAFESPTEDVAVGMHELTGRPSPFRAGERLFTFVR
jgi:hypothetical protein